MAVVASLNDYWKMLKLDVLFAPDKKKDTPKEETNDDNPDSSINAEEVQNDNDNESNHKGYTI